MCVAQGETSESRRIIKVKFENNLLFEGNLYRRTVHGLSFIRKVDDRASIMKGLHDRIGHWDFRTTYDLIIERFWWPTMHPDDDVFVGRCDVCWWTNLLEQHEPFGKLRVSGFIHI